MIYVQIQVLDNSSITALQELGDPTVFIVRPLYYFP